MHSPVYLNACNWTTPSSKHSSSFISLFHIGHNRGLVRVKFQGAMWPWYSKVRGEMATNTHWNIWVKTTGNSGSLFVSHMGFITWVNLENIRSEVPVWKFVRKWKLKSMQLPMWQVVVVLNMHRKFREKQSSSPFLQMLFFLLEQWY